MLDKRKDAFDFDDKNLCYSLNTLKVKHLPVTCSALGAEQVTFILNIY